MIQSVTRAQIVDRAKKIKPVKPKFIFGKYKGKTLAWVAENDPEYVNWVFNNVAKIYWPVGLAEVRSSIVYTSDQDADPDDLQERWARELADE